ATNGIESSKFSNRRAVFNFVYKKGKDNNAVVWLDQNINQDRRGISNNFSKIYKYLINSKLINNESLKESLIIADNKEKEKVSFLKKNQKDIKTLLKHNKDIRVIKSIRKDFSNFKELVNQYKGKSTILSQLIYAFEEQYSSLNAELGSTIYKVKSERNQKQIYLNETLTPKQNELNQSIGRISSKIEQTQKDKVTKEKSVKEIKSYEGLPFLQHSFQNMDKKRKEIESQITRIEFKNISSQVLENKISKTENEISKLTRQVENYSNQLIHKISDRQEDKELLNKILSTDITSLPVENISESITRTDNPMKLFNGAVSLPDNFEGIPIESIKDLRKKINQLHKEKKSNEKLLLIAKDLEQHQEDLKEIKEEIKLIENKIEQIKQL